MILPLGVIIAALLLNGCSAMQVAAIPVNTKSEASAQALKLEAFIYKPEGGGRFPVVIFNHGSAGGDPGRSMPAKRQAEFFVDRGFVVIVPMRRGRGQSDGVSPESEERNCDIQSWWPGLNAAFEDVTAVIDYARGLPFVDASQIVLAGASRGGFLSVAYAARGPDKEQVTGVVNFVGGWVAQAEDKCPTDFNDISFSAFGKESRTPMLWLYGENDKFYSSGSIQSYATAFVRNGGTLRFKLVGGVPENGHLLPDYPELWSAVVDEYLTTIEHN